MLDAPDLNIVLDRVSAAHLVVIARHGRRRVQHANDLFIELATLGVFIIPLVREVVAPWIERVLGQLSDRVVDAADGQIVHQHHRLSHLLLFLLEVIVPAQLLAADIRLAGHVGHL